jgi:hypothetical protein
MIEGGPAHADARALAIEELIEVTQLDLQKASAKKCVRQALASTDRASQGRAPA